MEQTFLMMKKLGKRWLNVFKKNYFVLVLLLGLAIFLTGCQTLQKVNEFSAASVLPQDADLYVRLPVKTNSALCKTLLKAYMPDLDESAQEKLVVSANTIFAAVKTEENGKKSVNIAVEGKFPFYTNFVLTDKNGWSKANKKEGNIKYTYYVHDTGFQLAIPTGNIALLSSTSVLPMLQACENNVMNNIYGVEEVSKREALLTSNIDSAAFYSENPKVFIKSIIGLDFSFGIAEAGGVLTTKGVNENSDLEYNLDLDLVLSEPRGIKATTFIVKTLFSAISKDIVIEQKGEDTLSCKNITVSENSVLSLVMGK